MSNFTQEDKYNEDPQGCVQTLLLWISFLHFYICISIRSHIIILVVIFPIYNNAYDCNGYEYCCYNYGNNNQTQ